MIRGHFQWPRVARARCHHRRHLAGLHPGLFVGLVLGSLLGPAWSSFVGSFFATGQNYFGPPRVFCKISVQKWSRNSGPKTGPPRDSKNWPASSRAKSGPEIRVQKWTRNSGLSRGRCCHFRAYLGFGKLGLFRRGRLGPEHRWALSEHAASCLHCPTDYGVLVNCSTHDSLWHTTGG